MPRPYRYTTPVTMEAATGTVAAVYAQMEADFVLDDGPLMSLSPAPDVLAATWALLREAELAGSAPRADKEIVATAVSVANRCPFCVDAHTILAHAAGDHRIAEAVRVGDPVAAPEQARLADWARATRSPGAPELVSPPYPPEAAAEYLGTVLVTHFINRMVTAQLDEELLLAPLQSSPQLRRLVGGKLERTGSGKPRSGESLDLLPRTPAGPVPCWAGDTPIGPAYAALEAVAAAGGTLLSASARAAVLAAVGRWDGSHPPLGSDALEAPLGALAPGDRPGARLALLAALGPYRITDEDVTAWRTGRTDAELIRLLAFGAMAAVDRIQGWITAGQRAEPDPARS
ncbi:carboxymuconolactone decarboxylase family protein [Streptomyces sp. 8N706]|uniref:carboxymuconolactone decarboxylase family protein n=1 Tax=Streptomyces sp. 8N706 TaxID=3457416 RepID=UPI003FD3EC7C